MIIGGAKVWECTETVGEYLTQINDGKCLIEDFKNRTVLDLGCGAGILGILALNNGASVHFQDYVRLFLNALVSILIFNENHLFHRIKLC